jgi:hypothetical protein
MRERVLDQRLDVVPPEMRQTLSALNAVHRTMQQSEAGAVVFIRVVEQDLQAHADAEQWYVAACGVAQCLSETR